jgi:predicted RNA binding protein YcfA (HicA-like mRNA interferase family)
MPKIPGLRHLDAVKAFEKLGYRVARQSGHIIRSNGKVRLVIPRNNPVNAITMGGIAKVAGLTPDNFGSCCEAMNRLPALTVG